MKKRIAAILLAVSVAVVMTACGNSGGQEAADNGGGAAETADSEAAGGGAADSEAQESAGAEADDVIKVGVSFGTLQEERWDAERERMQELADEDESFELIYTDADTDANLQNDQIENMLSQGIDVLVIGPQDGEAAATAVEAAKEMGVPVVSYCRVVNSDLIDVVVSYDYVTIGEKNMEMALQAVPNGNYVLVNGHDADSVPHDENKGYHNVIDEKVASGDVTIVYDQYTENWSADEAMSAVENVLTQNNNDIQAIICNNDGMAGGVVQALIAQGLEGKVYVAGMDAELSACQRIAEGTQSATVITGYDDLAEAVIKAALELARGEELSDVNGVTVINGKEIPTVACDPVVVTKENLVETVIDSGFRSVEDVFANVPKDQWPSE